MAESVASSELSRVLAHLQSAHRLAGIGSWELDVSGDGPPLIYWSPEVHAMAGRPLDQPPTLEDLVAMIHPDDRALFLDRRAAALSGERPYAMDLRVVLPSGEALRVHIVGRVIRDEHGRPVRLVGAVLDQTEEIEDLRQLRLIEVARRDLLERLLVTAEIERNRLARHLASGPIDRLVEIAQRLGDEIPADASQPWVEALAAVRKAIDSLDRTLTDIQAEPPSGDLAHLVDELTAEALVGLDVTTDVTLDASLRPPVQATVLRVMQEALHNVRKHAQATQVDVRVHVDGDVVHIAVTDDGRGFDAEAVRRKVGHLGLVAMEERIVALGGQLDIRSRPGRTVLEATIPFA